MALVDDHYLFQEKGFGLFPLSITGIAKVADIEVSSRETEHFQFRDTLLFLDVKMLMPACFSTREATFHHLVSSVSSVFLLLGWLGYKVSMRPKDNAWDKEFSMLDLRGRDVLFSVKLHPYELTIPIGEDGEDRGCPVAMLEEDSFQVLGSPPPSLTIHEGAGPDICLQARLAGPITGSAHDLLSEGVCELPPSEAILFEAFILIPANRQPYHARLGQTIKREKHLFQQGMWFTGYGKIVAMLRPEVLRKKHHEGLRNPPPGLRKE